MANFWILVFFLFPSYCCRFLFHTDIDAVLIMKKGSSSYLNGTTAVVHVRALLEGGKCTEQSKAIRQVAQEHQVKFKTLEAQYYRYRTTSTETLPLHDKRCLLTAVQEFSLLGCISAIWRAKNPLTRGDLSSFIMKFSFLTFYFLLPVI